MKITRKEQESLTKHEDKPFVTTERYNQAVAPCKAMALSRNKRYGNSIDIMKNASIIDLCLMKLIRTRELDEKDAKYYDEIVDVINYMIYLLIRRDNEYRKKFGKKNS